MATVVPFNNPATSDGQAHARTVANFVQSFFDCKHDRDHMIALKGGLAGTNWQAIATAYGCPTAQAGNDLWTKTDSWYAYMVSAYDSCADIDQMRPV